jgi:lipoprotein-anchoring transpeptidase ErfK/SrfK
MKAWQLGILLVTALGLCAVTWRLKPLWVSAFGLSGQDPIDPLQLVSTYEPEAGLAVFDNQELSVPQALADLGTQPEATTTVLGDHDAAKRIEIDLTNQRVYAYEGDQMVYNFLVSTGKWGRTPTGHFRIWVKLRYTKMSGGNQALGTYYYLPNVPFVMFFAGDGVSQAAGYSLHGTYWHNNFGHVMSHGCINMRTEEVEQLYYWAKPDLKGQQSIHASADNPGTEVIIYGEPAWE